MASSTTAAATGCPVSRCINQAASFTSAVDVLREQQQQRDQRDSSVSSGRGSPGGSSSGSLSSTSSSASSVADDLRIYNAGIHDFTSRMWQDLRKDIERRAHEPHPAPAATAAH